MRFPQRPSVDKESYLQVTRREYPVTLRVLRSMPDTQRELRPGAKSKSALELAWVFVVEEQLLQSLLRNERPTLQTAPPDTFAEIIALYEIEHEKTVRMVEAMSEDDLAATASFYVGPKTPGDVPKIALAQMLLLDAIHHRGQFSVYLRVAGAHVPSIYGPSADEPWT